MLTNKEARNVKRAKDNLESSYMKKTARSERVIILEQLNMIWDKKEIEGFRYLWKEGISIVDISNYFNRSQEECVALVLDQSMKGMIKQRKGGLLGWENVQE